MNKKCHVSVYMLSSSVSNQICSNTGVSDILIRFRLQTQRQLSMVDWVSPSKIPPKVLDYLSLKYSWLSRQHLLSFHCSQCTQLSSVYSIDSLSTLLKLMVIKRIIICIIRSNVNIFSNYTNKYCVVHVVTYG